MDNRVYIWSIEGYAYGLQFLCKMTIWYPEEDGLWGYGGVAHGYPNCYPISLCYSLFGSRPDWSSHCRIAELILEFNEPSPFFCTFLAGPARYDAHATLEWHPHCALFKFVAFLSLPAFHPRMPARLNAFHTVITLTKPMEWHLCISRISAFCSRNINR